MIENNFNYTEEELKKIELIAIEYAYHSLKKGTLDISYANKLQSEYGKMRILKDSIQYNIENSKKEKEIKEMKKDLEKVIEYSDKLMDIGDLCAEASGLYSSDSDCY